MLTHANFTAWGFAVVRATLAEGNKRRNWRIWADLAAVLIRRARKIYASEDLGVEPSKTVYPPDSSTMALYMSLLPLALFRSTKSAVKIHTLLNLRGALPTFIYVSDGNVHDTKVLDMLVFEPGAFYVVNRRYQDIQRLYRLHQAGAFYVTRAKSSFRARRVYSDTSDRSGDVIADQRVVLEGYYAAKDYPEHIRRIRFNDPATGKTLILLTNNTVLETTTIASLYKSRWQVNPPLQMDHTKPARQALFRHQRKRREDPNLVGRVHLPADFHYQKRAAN